MHDRRITSLKDVKTLEVSLVESGANKKKRFPVMKAKVPPMDDILVEVLKADGQTEAVLKLEEQLKKEEMPEDAKAAMKAAMKLLQAYSDVMPVKQALTALSNAAHEDKEEKAEHKDKEEKAEHDDKKEKNEHYDKAAHEEDEAKKMKDEEELKKSLDGLPAPARKAIDAIWKAKEELVAKSELLEKQLGQEIAKRARREYIAKAEKTLCNIPGHSLDDVVDLVIEAKARDEGFGSRIEKALEASSAALQGGALLVEAGRSVPDMSGGDSWSKIQRIAKSEVEKSGGSLSMPQAIAKTIQTNPALYEAYNADRERKNVGGR
tara:strand:+ start:1061 stop:2023 length:963 start_codon:yes stop_codon:yes gene_type:complete